MALQKTTHLPLNFKPLGCINKQMSVFAVVLATAMLLKLPAYGQLDYQYSRNNKGLRLGAGGGITQLLSHYDTHPWIGCFIGTLDYEFNPYLSIGIQGQIGTLQGIDNTNPPVQYYHSSTNDFKAINFNAKFGLGLINGFHPKNKFQDALKRLYLGLGVGAMQRNIKFTVDPEAENTYTNDYDQHGYMPLISANVGTLIDIGNIFGYDRIEINPDYQCTYIDSPYADGFRSSPGSKLKTFYNMISINIKYKF